MSGRDGCLEAAIAGSWGYKSGSQYEMKATPALRKLFVFRIGLGGGFHMDDYAWEPC